MSKQRRVEIDPGNPEQFCTPLNGLKNGTALCVSGYPTAWRIGVVDEEMHRGFGYVRSDRASFDAFVRFTDIPLQFFLGNQEYSLGLGIRLGPQWRRGGENSNTLAKLRSDFIP